MNIINDYLALYGMIALGVVGVLLLVASFGALINAYIQADEVNE